jgi:hypothetical protein
MARMLGMLLAVGCGACHSSFTTAAPRGFVELEDQGRYDFRATSPDGLVVAVRELDGEPEASLGFWTRAVTNAMRQRGGYALLETRDVQVAGNWPAKQLRFGHDEGSRPHLYYLTLVVSCSAIHLLEAGGEKALVERHEAELAAWVRDFSAERCAPFPFSFACTQLEAQAQPQAKAKPQ